MNHDAIELTELPPVSTRLDRERIHFNKVAIRYFPPDLVMPKWNIRRFDHPSPATVFPLEYAFHLLGEIEGKTIVDLGCGDGLNTVILAALGAKVIAVDISDKSLETTGNRVQANRLGKNVLLIQADAAGIPIADSSVEGVLCASMLRHVDCLAAARQIRRILKPGGVASFIEQLTGPQWLAKVKNVLPKPDHVIDDERPLTLQQVHAVGRAVGIFGRSREFMLTSRMLDRFGLVINRSYQLDSWILKHFEFMRALASPLVWEARKEC